MAWLHSFAKIRPTPARMPVPRSLLTTGRWIMQFGERQLKLYQLVALCVMPNHVHVVLDPKVPVPRITKSIKGFTARRANEILGRTGEPFWQDETYDHWIRSSEEQARIIRYTERKSRNGRPRGGS
jgi:REP element-mobilizing transposase RayT